MTARIPLAFVLLAIAMLGSSPASAQPNCKKGIPCGNSCIAANRVCHIAPTKSTPPAPADTPRAAVGSKAPPQDTAAPGAPANPAAPTLAADGKTKVWVNSKSRVYHCPGSRYYGTTSAGAFVTERAAVTAGNSAAYGKRCGT